MLGYAVVIMIFAIVGASIVLNFVLIDRYLGIQPSRDNNPTVISSYHDVEDSMRQVIESCKSAPCPDLQHWIDRTCYVDSRYSFCR